MMLLKRKSLPALLQHLPKDFGLGGDDISDSDSDDASASISGTMIVKTDWRRSSYSGRNVNVSSQYVKPWSTVVAPFRDRRSPKSRIGNEEEENARDFSTFVVRREDEEDEDEEGGEDGMGTMVRRGAGSGGGETMRKAVESMQKVGEAGAMGYRGVGQVELHSRDNHEVGKCRQVQYLTV